MPHSVVPNAPPESLDTRQRPLRRLTLELFGIIALKIAALTLIWWMVFAPQPKPDTNADAIAQRLAPTSHAMPEARP